MDMGSRSYSVSEIDTMFLMFDGGMESQVKQKISRVLTPGKLMDGDNKGAGIIIDLSFDSNRTQLTPIDLFIVSEAIKFSKEEETLQESIKRICNVYPIFVIFKLNPNVDPSAFVCKFYGVINQVDQNKKNLLAVSINIKGRIFGCKPGCKNQPFPFNNLSKLFTYIFYQSPQWKYRAIQLQCPGLNVAQVEHIVN